MKEKAIPISIWKNKGYQTVLEASAWDLSDFEYYIINVDPSQSGLYAFLETAHLKDKMFNWQMNDMLRACENDIPLDNIYLNIINSKNDCLETNLQNTKEVTLVQTELDSRKISSIHGICLYGEINSKTGTLRLCYSANYNIVDAEQFIELLDHLIQSLMKRD